MQQHDDETPHTLAPVEGIFTDLAEADISPPKWVIQDILPTGIMFLAGPPKTLKSTLEMAFSLTVAGIAHDVLPPEFTTATLTGPVMGLSAEATAGELRHMVEDGMKVKLPNDGRIIIADDPWSFRLDDPEGLEQILYWLDERKPRLFWLDPLRDLHHLDERDSGEMNRVLRPIQKWAKRHDSCFLVVHHMRKKANDDRTDYTATDMRGTTALFGLADGVIVITPRPGGKLHMTGTYKRGQGWEKTIALKMWGKGGPEEVNEVAQLASLISINERKVVTAMHKAKPLQSVVGAQAGRMSQAHLKQASARLGQMGLAKLFNNKFILTELGSLVAEVVVSESSVKGHA